MRTFISFILFSQMFAFHEEIPCVFIWDNIAYECALMIDGHKYDIMIVEHSDDCACKKDKVVSVD